MSCCLSRRSCRGCPAGLRSSFGPERWRDRSTFLSSLGRCLLLTARTLRVRRAGPRYTPSRFLCVSLRCLLQTCAACLLHVKTVCAAAGALRAAFIPALPQLSAVTCGRSLPVPSRTFPARVSRNGTRRLQREEPRGDLVLGYDLSY